MFQSFKMFFNDFKGSSRLLEDDQKPKNDVEVSLKSLPAFKGV